MKEMSVFEIIGPRMIGPSSSHTAGALRIALLAKRITQHPVTEVKFLLYGSFAQTFRGHGTDRALVAGILGMNTDDERIRDAFVIAAERGLSYSFETRPQANKNSMHPNTVDILMRDGQTEAETSIRGCSVGGGAVKITRINGVEVEFTGEYHTLVLCQHDAPGVVAHVTQCLARWGINIAFMRLYREAQGRRAYTIIEADEPIDCRVTEEIAANNAIDDVKLLSAF